MSNHCLQVINPSIQPPYLDAELIELEGNYDFKPYIGLLPTGELLMFVTHTHAEEPVTGGRLGMHTVLYRSTDGGRSWGQGRHVREMIGAHEPAVTVIDGIVFVTTHFYRRPGNDPHAGREYPYCILYRSDDYGLTFDAFEITGEMFGRPNDSLGQTSRNLIQLPGGRLLLGVDHGEESLVLYSDNLGKTWDSRPTSVAGQQMPRVMGESVFFFSPSGRLMMLSRQDYTKIHFDCEVPYLPRYTRDTGLDQFDGEILYESMDGGFHWRPVRAVGFPSLMYPSIVNLGGNRQLFTYTVREIPPAGTGCVHPVVGVQAAIVKERADGLLDFRLDRDVVVIDDCTPSSQRNAGCFGNTIALPDGTLVTPYSYPKIDADILVQAEQKAYLKPEVFDYWAAMQTTYDFRFASFICDDRELMEMKLRRAFSALFLYAQCANKGGIGTRVVRWRLSSISLQQSARSEL